MRDTYEIAFVSRKIIDDDLYAMHLDSFRRLVAMHDDLLLSLQLLYDGDGNEGNEDYSGADDVYELSAKPGAIASIIVSSPLLESVEEVSTLTEMVEKEMSSLLADLPFLSIVIREYILA